ncbi:MAG: hypothetical protein GY850_32400 [bacterium]|nr:hypothetical protein [bacterium]
MRKFSGLFLLLLICMLVFVGPSIGACTDADTDGICDDADNCPITSNADQQDTDNDGIGDVCDNCPDNCNANQKDADIDGAGDVCDDTPGCGGCGGPCETECTSYNINSPLTFASEITFSVKARDAQVDLAWTAVSEVDVLGYNIIRRQANGDDYEINDNLIVATGSPQTTVSYTFIDTDVVNGKLYSYILIEVGDNGSLNEHGPDRAIPRLFKK